MTKILNNRVISICAVLFTFATAVWTGSLEYKIQRVHSEHPTLEESRNAAFSFAQGMKASGYGDIQFVVFGASAVRNYFPAFRSTPDLDIIVYEPHDLRLNRLLEKAVENSNGELQWTENEERLLYIVDDDREVHIDVGYLDFGPLYGTDMRVSAKPAREVHERQDIPYATPEEMFVIKTCSSGRRSIYAKERQDVADAEFIAEHLLQLNIVGNPIDRSLECLQQFIPKSMYSESWWRAKISMFQVRSCSIDDWFYFKSVESIGEMVTSRLN